jgi:hypothetical protein
MKYRPPGAKKKIEKSEVEECYGKRIFLTWDHAASQAKGHGRRSHLHLSPYRCPHCKAIHVGSVDLDR